jgi:glucosyl-3-phosphoglycerate synthase
MPDLHQPGPVISLPLLSAAGDERLEFDLTIWAQKRPLGLMLPCHARDLESEAMSRIIETLAEIPWISRIVLGLDGAGEEQHASALKRLSVLKTPVDVLLQDNTKERPGKGRNLRACAKHLLSRSDLFAVAMHDCDIRTYSRSFLARLCWPVLHPEAGISACKGYYARNTVRLHGRVFRLMFQPLLRAWAELSPDNRWAAFLQSLRYPLSGELCVETSLLRRLKFDAGWGVDTGLLYGLYRHTGPRSICQAELCATYDHKHHGAQVLAEMAGEVALTLARTMQTENAGLDEFELKTMLQSYESFSREAVRESALTAQMNGLEHDEQEEAALAARMVIAVRSVVSVASGGKGAPHPFVDSHGIAG